MLDIFEYIFDICEKYLQQLVQIIYFIKKWTHSIEQALMGWQKLYGMTKNNK